MTVRNLLFMAFAAVASMPVHADVQPTFTEWHDMQVNEVNRFPMHTTFFAYESETKAMAGDPRGSANYLSLSGQWKFNWVADADKRPTDFYKDGYDDSSWKTMPVPGIWEVNGYGDPVYVNTGFAWRGHFKDNPPQVPVKDNHVGTYRRTIRIPDSWDGRQVIAHFGSVTSNIYLYVNGQFAGYSEDSKVATEFDITPYLKKGDNLISFQTFRWCDGSYSEDQDFWRLSGVARDSYLYCRDGKSHIDDIRITPDLTDNYKNGSLKIDVKATANATITSKLLDAEGNVVAKVAVFAPVKGKKKNADIVPVTIKVDNVKPWSCEIPYLYTLVTEVRNGNNVIEVIPQKVGFRKVEIKNSVLLINGKRVMIKGVDRHEMDPDGGYVVSRQQMIRDLQIMKQFNVNAIRTCHYPDDPVFYDLCDQYGFYMVAEANQESHGFGYADNSVAKTDLFAKPILERNQHNVQTYYNHPAVIMWSLGNETVDGPNFTAAYKWIKAEDPYRPVHWERAGRGANSDIVCPMYTPQSECEKYALSNDPSAQKPFIMCEYAHAMGNSCGGFGIYWDMVRKYPKFQGGYIWDFVDQALHGKDSKGRNIYTYGGDYNSYDASDNNFNCNGLISPDRLPNPHFYEVGYYYQSVWAEPVDLNEGVISVHNEYCFRDISNYKMVWSLMLDGKKVNSGEMDDIDIAPGTTRKYKLPLNVAAQPAKGELMLNIEFQLKKAEPLMAKGQVVAYRQMVVRTENWQEKFNDYANASMQNMKKGKLKVAENAKGNELKVCSKFLEVSFDKKTGFMTAYNSNGNDMIGEGGQLRPNFWRAVTDNDMGSGINKTYKVWRNPVMNLKSLTTENTKLNNAVNAIIVKASYDMPDVKATLNISYTISQRGAVLVEQQLVADPSAKVPSMMRFGMTLQMPYASSNSTFYGRGPVENYSDRKESQMVGVYTQDTDRQFYPYIRPQESGTKSDIRWWRQSAASGAGVNIVSDKLFSASALHYAVSDLDEGDKKEQRHSSQVPKSKYTELCIDEAQTGVGGVDSWSRHAEALPEYRVNYENRTFRFILMPMK